MEVTKALAGVALLLALTACSNNKTTESVFEDESTSQKLCSGQKLENQFIVTWEDGRITVETAPDAETFKREFVEKNLADIRQVEYDRLIQLRWPESSSLEQSSVGEFNSDWGAQMIKAPAVWSQGVSGQGILVGVVDSDVDVSHPQIQGRIAVNSGEIPGNGLDDDGNGYIDDVLGMSFVSEPGTGLNPHGTHVSGIISTDHNKGPIKGLAPQARLIPAPFISSTGRGSLGDAIMALQYVGSRGARVVNASWGGAPCVDSLRNAFVQLQNNGVLLIVAAGNDSRDLDRYPEYPAAFGLGTQITVAASTFSDFMADFSNSGLSMVHLAAPGKNIISTVPFSTDASGMRSFDGTSMAAPFVAGAAALIWSDRPQATALQVRQALLSSVDVVPRQEFRVSTRGRLNVEKALLHLRQLVP